MILTPYIFWPILALLLAPVAYGLVREQWGALRRLGSERGHTGQAVAVLIGAASMVLLLAIFVFSAQQDVDDRLSALETPVSETSSTEVAPEEAPQ